MAQEIRLLLSFMQKWVQHELNPFIPVSIVCFPVNPRRTLLPSFEESRLAHSFPKREKPPRDTDAYTKISRHHVSTIFACVCSTIFLCVWLVPCVEVLYLENRPFRHGLRTVTVLKAAVEAGIHIYCKRNLTAARNVRSPASVEKFYLVGFGSTWRIQSFRTLFVLLLWGGRSPSPVAGECWILSTQAPENNLQDKSATYTAETMLW